MTVDNDINRTDAVGDGSNDTFPFTFKVFADTELLVVTRGEDDDEDTTLVLNTDYTVDLNDDGTGEVILTDPLDNNATITIKPNLPFTQLLDAGQQGSFSPANHEEALDRQTILSHQLAEQLDRCMRLSESTDPDDVSVQLPPPVALEVLSWNADGTALTSIDPGDVDLAVPADASVATAKIQDGAVTLGKMADLDESRIVGRAASAGTGVPTALTAAQVRTLLSLVPDDATVEISGSNLRVKDAGITGAKLGIDAISGLTAETAIATGDYLMIGDVSATNIRKMLVTDFLKIVNALTADASPVAADDYVMTYDASASAPKKVLITNLSAALPAASTSASGIIEIATSTETQTGTDTNRAVVPGRMQYHQGVAKGWCHFEQSGTHSIIDSYNVTSIADGGVGTTTINWDTNFGNADFVTLATSATAFAAASSTGAGTSSVICAESITVSSFDEVDSTDVYCAAFGDL